MSTTTALKQCVKMVNGIKMQQQTAVEWLVSHLNKQGFAQVVTDEEIKQSNEMFEQQIKDAWNNGFIEFYDGSSTPEEYYKKTFKSE